MAPVIRALQAFPQLTVKICVTGQHREMLDQVLELFAITPDYDLQVMTKNQNLTSLTATLLLKLQEVIEQNRPALILVHGDTTTSMVAALAGFYSGIPVGHVEAGLRSGDKQQPFPEEVNRRLTAVLADMHFAPTEKAKINLLHEGIGEQQVKVTGNTVIDALFAIIARIEGETGLQAALREKFALLDGYERMVLITGHRRENFGAGFENICRAIVRLASTYPEVAFVYPVHLNPRVQQPVLAIIGNAARANVFLMEPVDYLSFVALLRRCTLVLTDSGGIQEEAPALGKPVVVMRATTERSEAVLAGTVELAGSDEEQIVAAVTRLLADPERYRQMSRISHAYGDGRAAVRIAAHVAEYLQIPS
jgi:UDP-N-acetylglucosamine 2-epimerase (non-hydrolysing)